MHMSLYMCVECCLFLRFVLALLFTIGLPMILCKHRQYRTMKIINSNIIRLHTNERLTVRLRLLYSLECVYVRHSDDHRPCVTHFIFISSFNFYFGLFGSRVYKKIGVQYVFILFLYHILLLLFRFRIRSGIGHFSLLKQ